ncbi:MAG TPA: hypothetical protein VL361_10760 [Candidatus Limnocylindrales bacterium]|jgi:hypothetical protein|nr:hypothetical protein [Candidatus Limnocylindrales bacterium]
MKIINRLIAGGLRYPRKTTKPAIFFCALAVLGGVLSGCLPTSVHPLYRVEDLIQEPALLGAWKASGDDGKDKWIFAPGEGKSYKLEIQTDDQRMICVAHVFKLGNERFLDVYPEERGLGETLKNNAYNLTLIPGHLFFWIRETDRALKMSCMGLDWLKELLKRDPKAAAHVLLPDGRVALTGETAALQTFVKEHLKDPDAWEKMYDDDGLRKIVAKPAEK